MSATTESTPRAFHPDQSRNLTLPGTTPGWDLGPERRIDDGQTLANALGWFSIGLGAAELFAARQLTEYLGMEGHEDLVRLYGAREIATGVGILSQRKPTGWIWGRVAGDLLDLGTLGAALTSDRAHRGPIIGAMAAVAGVAMLDVLCGNQLSRHQH